MIKVCMALATCIWLVACSHQDNETPRNAKQDVRETATGTTLSTSPDITPTSNISMKATTTGQPNELKSKSVTIIGNPINNQSFAEVPFERFGSSQFMATIEDINGKDRLHFYVQGATGGVELKYEPESPESFYEMKAVSFKDVNADGLKDIIIIADYTTGLGYMGAIPISQLLIFTQTESGFVENRSLEDRVHSASPYRMLNIPSVLELLNSDAKTGSAQAWAKLPLGSYTLNHSTKYSGSTITIEKNIGKSIVFSLAAFHANGGDAGIKKGNVNTGDLRSVTAQLTETEMIYRDGDYELSISLISTEDIYLRDNGKTYFGNNVDVNGPYSRK